VSAAFVDNIFTLAHFAIRKNAYAPTADFPAAAAAAAAGVNGGALQAAKRQRVDQTS